MQPAIQRDPIPDRTPEPMASVTRPQGHFSGDSHQLPGSSPEGVSDQSWTPKLDRRQSWSQEDQKHQQQERLLNVEKERESGFTETGRTTQPT